jgi:hypothetical protein
MKLVFLKRDGELSLEAKYIYKNAAIYAIAACARATLAET